jgi:hypothetical protein
VLPAPFFGQAEMALHPSRLSAGKGRIEDLSELPPVGARILIRPAQSSGGAEFQGIITAHRVELTENSEILVAEADHLLRHLLSSKLMTRWEMVGQEAVEVPAERIRFNTGQTCLASASTIEVRKRSARIFDSSTSSHRWSVADALGYLIAATVPEDVESPGLDELEQLTAHAELGELDITGKTAAEALVEVAHRGGLELRASREGIGLVLYRPGRDGRRSSVCLQSPGESLFPARSNFWRGSLRLRRRPSRRTVTALGERKRYESTFQLKGGWDESLETPRWRDFTRSESETWPQLANVYRKWVLNEHGWYCPAPWQLDVYDFSSISADDFLVLAPRRFIPCLSADRTGTSLGVAVEFRCSSTDDWRQWALPVWVASDECAVYLGGDCLPGEFFQAAVDHTVELRVTATVEADTRLTAEVPGDPGSLREILDFSSQAAWRKVHSGSVFFGDDGLGQPHERDDTNRLVHLARRSAEAISTSTEAELTLGCIDTSYLVGDIIERIDGRGLELAGNPDAKPFVLSVRHDFADCQSTTLIVSG